MSALGQKQTYAAQKVMSALPPIADMCSATRYVRFVPIADMDQTYSITSSARPSNGKENIRPCTFAVFRLITNSTLVCCSTGNSAAFAPLRIFPL